jgi:hypothetical protein
MFADKTADLVLFDDRHAGQVAAHHGPDVLFVARHPAGFGDLLQ